MTRRLAVLVAFSLFATTAHAQSLNDLLGDLTAQMGRSNDEGQATIAALNAGDLSGACRHVAARGGYLDAASRDLEAMQSGLDASTTMSDAARADWQYHITDAKGSVAQLANANNANQSRYCA